MTCHNCCKHSRLPFASTVMSGQFALSVSSGCTGLTRKSHEVIYNEYIEPNRNTEKNGRSLFYTPFTVDEVRRALPVTSEDFPITSPRFSPIYPFFIAMLVQHLRPRQPKVAEFQNLLKSSSPHAFRYGSQCKRYDPIKNRTHKSAPINSLESCEAGPAFL